MKIKKGDTVKIMTGKDKGTEAKIEKAYPKEDKVLILNVNIFKKHMKKTEQSQGGIISVPRPLDVSKVMLICPHCKKPSRIGIKVVDGKRNRYCKHCSKNI